MAGRGKVAPNLGSYVSLKLDHLLSSIVSMPLKKIICSCHRTTVSRFGLGKGMTIKAVCPQCR